MDKTPDPKHDDQPDKTGAEQPEHAKPPDAGASTIDEQTAREISENDDTPG